MSRLIIISNRLPITLKRDEEGKLNYLPSAGGLATGLNSLDNSYDKLWIGWPGMDTPDEAERERIRQDLRHRKLAPVFLSTEEVELYYEGFSNKVIWPHFHYFTQYTTYNEAYWEAYRAVNRKFAETVIPLLREDDMVWVHDYQLMLLPQLIREAFPKMSIGFFLHIPFPSYEVFRILPWREELLTGVLGADQIGFHTFGYMRHFLSAAYRLSGHEHKFGRLTVGRRTVNVDVFPMGIDYEKYANPAVDLNVQDDAFQIEQLHRNRKLIISIDRLDYTKGIPQRLRGYATFLEEHPEWLRKVVLVMVVVPSRANVDQYQDLKEEVEQLVSRLNGKYGTFDWVPVQYMYHSVSFNELTTLYREAEVALLTPLRDGMNLVAKEFLAAKEHNPQGVLVLSEMAGAANELTEALLVNPQDRHRIAKALHEALSMNAQEQEWRLRTMQHKIKAYDVRHWASVFIQEQQKLMQNNQQRNQTSVLDLPQIKKAYQDSKKRLIILDYDGTLMGFNVDPQAVAPDEDLLATLTQLVQREGTKVVVNSGRDRATLEKWLGHLPIEMAAEHGVWMKQGGKWTRNPNLTNSWMPEVKHMLEDLVKRTPGSFIEEKDFSLAWHYRSIDKDLGEKRVREFRDVLLYLTHNQDLQVLEGNKVVEIKNAGVNKGNATLAWSQQQDWDFILAFGDDETDEDIFRNLPDTAYTVKIGLDRTVARFSLPGVQEVRHTLKNL
jgi:trehalose 6-phosphate synthase/phosphatase